MVKFSKNTKSFVLKLISNIGFQICILEGTRASIERCLELIQEKFPADQYPDFSLDQINRPAPEMIQHDDTGVSVVLPEGRMTSIVITAIGNAQVLNL